MAGRWQAGRRLQVPRLRGPVRAAGGWGLPGTGISRPVTATLGDYPGLMRVAIRGGEGTTTRVVPVSGIVAVALGPDALNTWYVSHCVLSTTTGAADTSTCQIQLGPYTGGIIPGGQSYAGGGDTVSLGGRALRPGEYVTAVWAGAHSGDLATLTVYGVQDILA